MSNDHPEWSSGRFARHWLALAERRRDDLVELYRSGRWRRYYDEAQLLAAMRAVKADIESWNALAEQAPVSEAQEFRKAG